MIQMIVQTPRENKRMVSTSMSFHSISSGHWPTHCPYLPSFFLFFSFSNFSLRKYHSYHSLIYIFAKCIWLCEVCWWMLFNSGLKNNLRNHQNWNWILTNLCEHCCVWKSLNEDAYNLLIIKEFFFYKRIFQISMTLQVFYRKSSLKKK